MRVLRQLFSGRKFCALALFLMLLAATAVLGAPKATTVHPCADSSLPQGIKSALALEGYRVTLNDGSTVDVCPSTKIPTSTKARADATYSLAPSTFLGTIHFEKNARDYRGNAVAAGTYNLRYELAPNDGDHLGTAPTPDFLLLIPPTTDPDPNQTYTFDQLVALSRQVTGKKHAAPLNLVAPDAKDYPSVATDSEDRTILFFKARTQSGDSPFALVVKGTTSE